MKSQQIFMNLMKQWVRSTSIPPMPTARSSTTVVSWSSPPAQIICGGRNEQNQPINIVEVYHSRTSQWHAVTPLPFPRANMTHMVIHNVLYLVCGYEGKEAISCKKTVLSTLIPHATIRDQFAIISHTMAASFDNYCLQLQTYCCFSGRMLVSSGRSQGSKLAFKTQLSIYIVVSSVHAYCPSTSS